LVVIMAGVKEAAIASHFDPINALPMAADLEDVHSLRQHDGPGYIMSRVNNNVVPLTPRQLA